MPSNEDIDNNLDTSSQNLDTGTENNNADPAPADPIDHPESAAAKAADALTADGSDEELRTDKPTSSSMKALLDQLSVGSDEPSEPAGDEPTPAPTEAATDTGSEQPAAEVAPAEPATPEQAEEEALADVKSPRGKQRIQQVFAKSKQLEADYNEIRNVILNTGLTPPEFANTLEFSRLRKSDDVADNRIALEMIEATRSELYQKLGIEAPGVDLLEGYDDLKQAVDNMEITKERALELVKYRKQEAITRQTQEQAQRIAQDNTRHHQVLEQGKSQTAAFLESKKNQIDFPVKEKLLKDYFQNAAQRDAFVQNFSPEQWGAAIEMLWNGFAVPQSAPTANVPQPIRSRPATLGKPSVAGATPMDKLTSIVDRF